MIQVVDGIAVDVLHQVVGHLVLEQIPLVTKVLASAHSDVHVRHLMGLRLELLQPVVLQWDGIHLHEEKGIIHALVCAGVHGIHDALEDRVGTGDPVLVRGVAVAVIHILLRVEHGRHALDARETLHPVVHGTCGDVGAAVHVCIHLHLESMLEVHHHIVGHLALRKVFAVDKNQVLDRIWCL